MHKRSKITQKIENKTNKPARYKKYSNYDLIFDSISSSLEENINSINSIPAEKYLFDINPYIINRVYKTSTTPSTDYIKVNNLNELLRISPGESDFVELSNFVRRHTYSQEVEEIDINSDEQITLINKYISPDYRFYCMLSASTPVDLTVDEEDTFTVTLYGIDVFGNNISESIRFDYPSTQKIKTQFSYLSEARINKLNLDIQVKVTNNAGVYPSLDENSLSLSQINEEYLFDNTKIYYTWDLNEDGILRKRQFTAIQYYKYLNGKLHKFDEYLYDVDTSYSSMYHDKWFNLIYALKDNKIFIINPNHKVFNISEYEELKSESFCPLSFNIMSTTFKLEYKVEAMSSRVKKYRIRLFYNGSEYKYIDNNTVEVGVGEWSYIDKYDKFGFISPEFILPWDKPFAIKVEVYDFYDRFSSDYIVIESVDNKYKEILEINEIELDETITDYTIKTTYDNKIILNNKILDFGYKYYYENNGFYYFASNPGNSDAVNLNTIIDNFAIIHGVERKDGESIHDFAYFLRMASNRPLGTDKKSLLFNISANLRIPIYSFIITAADQKVRVLSKDSYLEIFDTIITEVDLSNIMSNEVIDAFSLSYIAEDNIIETKPAKHLIPAKNFEVRRLVVEANKEIDLPIYQDEDLINAYVVDDVEYSGFQRNGYKLKIESKFKYITIEMIYLKKYYSILYSPIFLDSIKNHVDKIDKATLNRIYLQ